MGHRQKRKEGTGDHVVSLIRGATMYVLHLCHPDGNMENVQQVGWKREALLDRNRARRCVSEARSRWAHGNLPECGAFRSAQLVIDTFSWSSGWVKPGERLIVRKD